MRKKLERMIFDTSCGIVFGDRGCGKSTLFAAIIEVFKANDYDVYCQYPYKGCYQIPLKEYTVNGVTRYDIDKDWLYSANLSYSCILIDEGRTVWPARGFKSWTAQDEDFFNFIRKNHTCVFVATQDYNSLDLNIRKAADFTYFLTPSFWHFSYIETSKSTVAKVSDRNTEVLGKAFRQGMSKVSYEICEIPLGNFYFWRKPYYNSFLTAHTLSDKPFKPTPIWDDILDFTAEQEKEGFISESNLITKINDYLADVKQKALELEQFEFDKNNDLNDDFYLYDLDDSSSELDKDIEEYKISKVGKLKYSLIIRSVTLLHKVTSFINSKFNGADRGQNDENKT